ncbi:MAG: hypothetical protein ACR2N5_05195 [Solirubrobacterales bacterium]
MPLPRTIVRISGLLAAVVLLPLAFANANAQAQSGSLTTAFNSDNDSAGNTFDLEVKHPAGVTIESFDVNVDSPGATAVVEVWTRPGTAVGFEDTTVGWTSRGSFSATSAGRDAPTSVPISFSLPKGTYGVAVGASNLPTVFWWFTAGVPTTFEDAVLKLVSGQALDVPLLTGSVGEGIWDGTIHYSVGSAECKALADALADANSQLSAANDEVSAANDEVSAAEKKKKKAKRKVKKAKKKLKAAKQSGDANKVKKAKKKLKKAKKKLKKAKKKLKKAKAAATQAEDEAGQAQAAASQAQAAFD